MPPARVLWVAAPNQRPGEIASARLLTANSQAAAMERIDALAESGEHLDAVVSAPALPDGDGSAVLRAVREAWPDAACFLHGNLWAIPAGSSLPVCEFHPTGQTPAEVAEAVTQAVRGRYHRAYPVSRNEDRRLEVVDAVDFEGARDDLEDVAVETASEAEADLAFVSVVEDYTVWLPATSSGVEHTVFRRGDTACTYAIEESGLTVIEDVKADGRFTHVEQSCERDLRAYAGRRLSVQESAVAVLGVVDGEPDGFTEMQLDALSRYADEAERVLASVA